MIGLNNEFCSSKEEYEIARLATKCAGLQGRIDDLTAEIDRLETKVDQLEWANKGVAEWRDVAKEYKALCAQLAEALEYACKSVPPLSTVPGIEAAMSAWTERC